MKRKYMTTSDQTITYYDEGQGEPIFMLHGFPDSADVWRKLIPMFVNQGYRVIAPDMRGFGQSSIPENVGDFSIQFIMADILKLKKFLNIDQPAKLIAHDWGANIGWMLASFYQSEFESYIAISVGHPYSYAKDGGFEQQKKGWYTMAFLFEGLAEELFSQNNWAGLRTFTQNHPELDSHWIPDLSREGRFTAALNLYRANLEPHNNSQTPDIPQSQIPILGIYGTNDLYLSEAQMKNSSKYLDGEFDYVTVKGGHWLPIDEPEFIFDQATKFYNHQTK
ncbi:alpha/beta hydrolase [Lentilactobacillus sp. SPB1-3]|uniref:Alpha/beta hydrolase n=1 Tax=Lentilactobacillus terminaliae TaxID=3003483 RepID=A0ACD5DEB4_9LACO|nr:alpha/beta hydrolase [Lentilactobacillus sp. SPB1-3]MCZ0977680.1 alpha/beta hydrolase [Lentilactobacillus sp. SPB1-3]